MGDLRSPDPQSFVMFILGLGLSAAVVGNLASARKLLEARADPGTRNELGRPPLDLARERGMEEASGLLLRAAEAS